MDEFDYSSEETSSEFTDSQTESTPCDKLKMSSQIKYKNAKLRKNVDIPLYLWLILKILEKSIIENTSLFCRIR